MAEKNGECQVYFISASRHKGCEPVKIGISKNPEKRMSDLQTANCNKLKLAATIVCSSESDARKLERTLHRLAGKKHQKLSGEWFVIRGSFKSLIEQSLKMSRVQLPASEAA